MAGIGCCIRLCGITPFLVLACASPPSNPPDALPPPVISTGTLAPAVTGKTYSLTVEAKSDRPPLTWSIVTAVPELSWVSIDPSSGVLKGTPSATVVGDLTIQATDRLGQSGQKAFVLAVLSAPSAQPPPVISTALLAPAVKGQPYSQPLDATSDFAPLTWSLPAVPAELSWISIDAATGRLAGTPPAVLDSANLTVQVTDQLGQAGQKSFALRTLDPSDGTPPSVQYFRAAPEIIMAGSSAALTWSTTGAEALSIDQQVGPVTGEQIVLKPAATTTYTLTATNGAGSATARATVTVRVGNSLCDLRDLYTDLPTLTSPLVGKGYAMQLITAGSYDDAMLKCTDDVYKDQLMVQYALAGNTNPVQWEVYYQPTGVHGCAASGCGYH